MDVQEGEFLLGEVVSNRAERGSFRRLWVPACSGRGKWKCGERWLGVKDQLTALGTAACTILEYYTSHIHTYMYACTYAIHLYTRKILLKLHILTYTHLHHTTPHPTPPPPLPALYNKFVDPSRAAGGRGQALAVK